MPKVSVIVTIYNAGPYLRRCLDSLSSQTLTDVEFILVLDCPTDGSEKIAKNYADLDNRFIVVENKKNLHIGESRNVGILHAKGEYITFIDHDDFCSLSMLEILYQEACLNKADIVFSPLVEYYEERQEEVTKGAFIDKSMSVKECLLRQIVAQGSNEEKHSHYNQVHGVLYLLSTIKNSNVTFPNTRNTLPEDSLFNVSALLNSRKVAYVNHGLYRHVTNVINTASNIAYYDIKKRINGFRILKEVLSKYALFSEYKREYYMGIVRSMNCVILEHASCRRYFSVYEAIMYSKYDPDIRMAYKTFSDRGNNNKINLFNSVVEFLIKF